MGFDTGLSGLNAASQNLDVIGNNVANASTVGFKSSQAEFADVFAASLAGAGSTQIGIGTRLADAAQQFTQGNITSTSNPLDVAINGKGFFVLSNNGASSYTRNGQFQLDKNNNIVTSSGLNLEGYQTDANGNITGALGNLSVPTTTQPPQETGVNGADAAGTGAKVQLNLDSRSTVPTTPVFSPADPTSYNNSTSFQIYDSLGNAHTMALYFVDTAAAGTWTMHATVDGTPETNVTVGSPTTLAFDTSGKLTTAMPIPMSVDLAGVATSLGTTTGATTPLLFNLDFTGTTQFGAAFGVNSTSQDGYAAGQLAGFNIGSDGILQGRYTNGQTRTLGQVALANFADPQGLQELGNNQWAQTPSSGAALIGAPGSASLGVLQSSATEDSNVDLTQELVNMIVAQQNYQANAQTIKTEDAIQQTLVNLR